MVCSVLEAAELLRSYALSRGWVAASGLPDETRSGRQILKDFVNGKLLHCERPPSSTLSNAQLGLSGQNIIPSKYATPATQAGSSAALDQAQAQAQTHHSGDSQTQSDAEADSAAELADSSEQDGDELSGEQESVSDNAVSSSSDAEAAPAPRPVMSDADRQLMESMSAAPGMLYVSLLLYLCCSTWHLCLAKLVTCMWGVTQLDYQGEDNFCVP